MICDTTFIIDIMSNDVDAVKKLSESDDYTITTITLFELWSGLVQSKKHEKEKMKILNVLQSCNLYDLDKQSAKEGGIIDGTLIKEGVRIDPEDCMIAGIAKSHKESILTRNTKHFKRIKKLSVETY